MLEQIDTSDFEGLRDRLIVELFYTTGMRRIELIDIKVQDVNIAGKQLKVLGKRQKERIINEARTYHIWKNNKKI